MNKTELHESIIKNSQMTFARSGGNGGQNVNKLNTKVHLVLSVSSLAGISEEEKQLLREKLKSILNSDDCLFLNVDDERYQERNREIALALAAKDVRIQAPIPGKNTIGIELPNKSISMVTIRINLNLRLNLCLRFLILLNCSFSNPTLTFSFIALLPYIQRHA